MLKTEEETRATGTASSLAFILAVLLTVPPPVRSQDVPNLDFEKYELDNGLDVILYQDRSAPIISVNLWYHVGSGNEEAGRTGFAHLFEHMMFEGSEHHPDDYDVLLDKIGAFVNGSTNTDRTNYITDVPSNYLELALWLESDRMGFLLPALTEEKFEIQRNVVKNERRQNYAAEPYGEWSPLLAEMLFPPDHPYSWTTIGSMEDLDAASLDDVKSFFERYYTPNNASLVLAGDFDVDEAKRLVDTYFAAIPPGPPVDRVTDWLPELREPVVQTSQDDIELPRVYYGWVTPGLYKPGDAEFDLLASILTSGKTSRLYQSLVYDRAIAQDVEAFQWSREMASIFVVEATAREGRSLEELEAALDSVLAEVLENGVSEPELAAAATGSRANIVRSMQDVGGFGGIADRLNSYNRYLATPDGIAFDFNRYGEVTTESVRAHARRFLDPQKRATLRFVPKGDLRADSSTVNRTVIPTPGEEPAFTPPVIQRSELANGLDVLVIEDHDLPLIEVRLVVESGFADDPVDLPGVASLTADLLDEGTESLSALEIDKEKKRLAVDMSTGSFFDGSNLRMNILKSKFDDGMALFAEIALHPSFPEEEIERQRGIYQGRIAQHARDAQITTIKTFLKLLYGEGHPYGQPYTGTGTAESIATIARDDIRSFYRQNYLPNNSAIIFAGDLSLEDATAAAQKFFGEWERGEVADRDFPDTPERSKRQIVVVDKPGVEQSVIVVGQPSMARSHPDFRAFQVVNTALGGVSQSRINQNVREDKGYSYGAGSLLLATRGIAPFLIIAPVQTDKTAESLVEILKEYREITSTRPVTEVEVADAKGNLIKGFPQNFQSLQGVAAAAGSIVMFDLPDDSWQRFAGEIDAITPEVATQTAVEHLDAESALVIIVGDRSQFEDKLRELGLGDVRVL